LLIALARRLLLRPVLEVGAKAEVGVLSTFLYSVIYALYKRLVPYGYTRGKGEGLRVCPTRLGLVSLLKGEEAKLAIKVARAASRPACLIRLSLAFVGQTMLLFLVFRRVRQLL
jgi:hypothetical protein